MHSAGGELPDQPRIDGAESEFASQRAPPGAGHAVEQPCHLGAGEIRVEHEAGALAEQFAVSVGLELPAAVGGAPVLPDDGVADRPPGGAFPDDGGLALVGDADRRDLGGAQAGGGERLAGSGDLGRPDHLRILLDPARPRKDLR